METNRPLDCSIEGLSSFLSYLWGMETTFPSYITDSLNRSYPTYEEWKPVLCYFYLFLFKSSYPTYEEWKQCCCIFSYEFFKRSYPTYEEWKPHFLRILRIHWTVLILPMRNGNYYYRCEDYCCYSCSYPTYEEWKLFFLKLSHL